MRCVPLPSRPVFCCSQSNALAANSCIGMPEGLKSCMLRIESLNSWYRYPDLVVYDQPFQRTRMAARCRQAGLGRFRR
jgi:hypothetical protein